MLTHTREGLVVTTLASPVHDYPTYPQPFHIVDPQGIFGDSHYGPDRGSFTQPGLRKWNDRPICIVAEEAEQLVNERFGTKLGPGNFNEQLLVRGLGNLSWVLIGSVISFSDSHVQLEVVDRAFPCDKMAAYTGVPTNELTKVLVNETPRVEDKKSSARGILAKVLHSGIIRPESTIYVSTPYSL